MKKIIGLFILGSLVMTTNTGCKKKGCTDNTATNYNSAAKKDDGTCLYAPIITMNGAAELTINVGTTYNDAGATATNKDGSTVTVTTSNTVDASTTGTYYVTYTATNANGTATAQRKVNVIVGQDNWVVSWSLTSDCGATAFPLASAPVISAGSNATSLNIDNMFNLIGGTATATTSGSHITIPQQTVDATVGQITFSGTGTMNAQGNIIVITYTYDNNAPLIGGSGTCTATYVKQ
ncbi:MAG: immunoglobulin-like domain-containing protein [Flavobacteriales bacterium]